MNRWTSDVTSGKKILCVFSSFMDSLYYASFMDTPPPPNSFALSISRLDLRWMGPTGGGQVLLKAKLLPAPDGPLWGSLNIECRAKSTPAHRLLLLCPGHINMSLGKGHLSSCPPLHHHATASGRSLSDALSVDTGGVRLTSWRVTALQRSSPNLT